MRRRAASLPAKNSLKTLTSGWACTTWRKQNTQDLPIMITEEKDNFHALPLPPSAQSDATAQREPGPLLSWGFLVHSQWHITVGRTPVYEESANHRDLYLTTHNSHKRQTFMPAAGFELAVPATCRSQTIVLGRSAAVIGRKTAGHRKSLTLTTHQQNGLKFKE